jgi:hypothetical protein
MGFPGEELVDLAQHQQGAAALQLGPHERNLRQSYSSCSSKAYHIRCWY